MLAESAPSKGRSAVRKFLVLLLIFVVSASGVAFAARPQAKSKSHQTSGDIYVSVIHSGAKGLFYADGDFKDRLLGRGAIIYRVGVSTGPEPASVLVKSPSVTIYTRMGSLTGKGQATQITTGTGDAAKTTIKDGTFSLTRGTGAYKGSTLKGTFSGDLDGSVYHFRYEGTYRYKPKYHR